MPNPPVDVDSWGGSACYPRSTFYPLSDGHSTLSRRITRAYFRICSTCRSRSQARLCSCTLRSIANRSERTLRAPPLHFRRRPPQSNYPPGTVPHPDSRSGVRSPICRGWYSKVGSTEAGAPVSQPPTYPLHDKPVTNAERLRQGVSRKAKLRTEAPVNVGRNYNGPKVGINCLSKIRLFAGTSGEFGATAIR